jgi:hypothetical protein
LDRLLESDLTDAGKKDTCPFCKAVFIVPGQRELNEIQDAAKQAEAEKTRKDEERRAAKAHSIRQREEWLRLQEEERIRRVEEQRQGDAKRDENLQAAIKTFVKTHPAPAAALPAFNAAEPSEGVTVLLWLLFAFGFVWTCYFFWGYETSVPTADYIYAERVQNVGLLAHQQQGVIIGIGLMVISAIFIAERRVRLAIINPAVRQATHDSPLIKPMKPLY